MISGLLALLLLASPDAVSPDQTPIDCDHCSDWNQEQAPFRIFADTYYVGMHGLSSLLIVTKGGMILLDGDLPQSAQAIFDHMKALGFDPHNVRWILSSHAHFDQAGGIAALQRMTGANVAAGAINAATLQVGVVPADDPQSDSGKAARFPPVQHINPVLDGETISLGDTVVTAHYTPGHTPGGTTWTWSSCDNFHCIDMVYADSLDPVSAGNFRYGDTSRSPTTAELLRRSIALVHGLPCDIMISVNPDASGVFDKAAANVRDPKNNAFVDRASCRNYADKAGKALDDRLKNEASGASH